MQDYFIQFYRQLLFHMLELYFTLTKLENKSSKA